MFGPTVDRNLADPQIFAERDRRVVERLRAGLTAVADATNILPEARARLASIAPAIRCPVVVLRFGQPEVVLIAQNAERDKCLPVQEIRDYATLMAEYATSEQLRAEDVWAVYEVPGRDQRVNAAKAAARVQTAEAPAGRRSSRELGA